MSIRRVVLYFVITISTIVILASILSLFYNLPYWYSKLLDFPRLQYLLIGVICLIIFSLLTKKWKIPSFLLAFGLLASISIQSTRIFPYWFGEKTVPDAVENYSEENSVSVLLTNVLITNNEVEKTLSMIKNADPDIIIAMEVNEWWVSELRPLKENYPYFVERSNDEAYGMALYSRLELTETEVKYIKHKNVPSFHTKVQLESGKEFKLHAVHPVAPMPSDKYPDNVGEAEIELVRVGEYVSREQLPSMVAGDFNDVSWSNTSRLFGNDGKLANSRLGRGLFNTFDVNSIIMRWPLDHYYVTKEFQLADIHLLEDIGSDHYPIIAKFVLRN